MDTYHELKGLTTGNIRAVQIEKGRWHNLESFESGSVLFEAKDGEWEPYELFEKQVIRYRDFLCAQVEQRLMVRNHRTEQKISCSKIV